MHRTLLMLTTLSLAAACGASTPTTLEDESPGAFDCPTGTFVPGPRPGLGHCETQAGRKTGPAIEEATDFGTDVIGIGVYVEGKRHGPWNFSRADAEVASGAYQFGKRAGAWRFGPADVPTASGAYADGQPDGAWAFRCSDGEACSGRYENGQQVEWRFPVSEEPDAEYVVQLVGPLWRRELRIGEFVRAWHIIEEPQAWTSWVPGATVDIPQGWTDERWPTACDGPFRVFHAPKRTAVLGTCRAGSPEGDIRAYAPTGGLIREEHWVDAKRHGAQRWYDADGNLRRLEHRAQGELEGPLEVYGRGDVKLVSGSYYEGQPVDDWNLWWPGGTRRASGSFETVDAIQECLAAAEDDQTARCDAVRGRPTGTWTYWHPNGKRMAKVAQKDNGWAVRYWTAAEKKAELPGELEVEAPEAITEAVRACLAMRPSGWAYWQHGETTLRFARVEGQATVTSEPHRLSPGIESCLVGVEPAADTDVRIVFGEPHPSTNETTQTEE